MAVTYGFFDSVNGDRKYNADQMSEFYTGIANDGVFQHIDNGLAVSAGTGLTVNVATGRALIQKKWVKNDAVLTKTISAASATYARIDAVVIRFSKSNRNISIVVKDGTPAASPAAPSLTRNSDVYEMALAYVNVAANATSVTVTDKRSDTTVCGWVSVAQQTSGEVDAMLNAMKTGFDGVEYSSPAAMVQGCDTRLSRDISNEVGYRQKIDEAQNNEIYMINENQIWDENKIKWGVGYFSNGETYENTDGHCFEFPATEGTKYYFRKLNSEGERITGNAVRLCAVKSDGTYYYDTKTAIENAGTYTVPEGSGITKIIISNPNTRLLKGLYYSITVGLPANSAWRHVGKIPKMQSDIEALQESVVPITKTKICGIGDSLTNGSGGNGTTYETVLAANDPNLVVDKCAFSGKGSGYIAYGTGGYNLYVNPFTIPAAATAVEIETVTGKLGAYKMTVTSGMNPVIIAGVEGTISYSDDTGKNYFTRTEAGESIEVTRPERIITNFESNHADDICIIWVGTNNESISTKDDDLFYVINNIIGRMATDRYIVLPVMTKSKFNNLDSIITYYYINFGSHFVNHRNYMLSYGLEDAGITPTAQDETDISNGEIPTSLRSDATHLNAAGYTVLGNFLYKTLKNMGYID